MVLFFIYKTLNIPSTHIKDECFPRWNNKRSDIILPFGVTRTAKKTLHYIALILLKFLTRSKKESIRTGFQKFYNIITHNIQAFNLS